MLSVACNLGQDQVAKLIERRVAVWVAFKLINGILFILLTLLKLRAVVDWAVGVALVGRVGRARERPKCEGKRSST